MHDLTSDLGAPKVVDRHTFQAELDALRVLLIGSAPNQER